MKIKVTSLKAPWPEGTKVGDVLEVGDDEVPGWALGKFTPVGEKSAPARAPANSGDAEELEVAQNMLAEAKRGLDDVTARLTSVTADRDAAMNDLAVAQAEAQRLTEELVAAKQSIDAQAARLAAYDACNNAEDLKKLRKQ